MSVAVGSFLHHLHSIQPGQIIGGTGWNDADVFRVDGQGRLLGRDKQIRLVVADQLVGGVGQDTGKDGVIGILGSFLKLDPQKALAGLGGGIFLVALVGRKGGPG